MKKLKYHKIIVELAVSTVAVTADRRINMETNLKTADRRKWKYLPNKKQAKNFGDGILFSSMRLF